MKEKFYNNKIIIIFVAITMIFCSGHAWYTVRPSVFGLIYPLLLIFIIPVYNKFAKPINLHMAALLTMLLMIFSTFITGFGASLSYYLPIFCTIICAFGITLNYSFEKFVDIYLKVMTVVTVIGVIGYYLVMFTPLLQFLPEFTNVNDVVYKMGFIYNYIVEVPDRNCAMFWEPGLFATYLIISIVFESIFKKGKTNILRIVIFSIGIITANSSAGFLLLFLSLWMLATKKQSAGTISFSYKMVFSTVFFMAGLVVLINFEDIITSTSLADNEYFNKLLLDNVAESSRNKAILHNLEIFASAPIFGAGAAAVFNNIEHVADTSTSTFILSMFGIMGAFYTVFWLWGIFRQREINLITKLILATIIIIIINKEPHLQMLFTWCLFFYLLKDNNTEENQTILTSDQINV